jgi:signal transduction histidine kinase
MPGRDKNRTPRLRRLSKAINELQRTSCSTGSSRFDPQPVAPAELLHDALESFRKIAGAQGIELTAEDSATPMVNADREAIYQVLSNLIDNALKYGANGGRVIVSIVWTKHALANQEALD